MLGEVTGCDEFGNYQLAIPWDWYNNYSIF
jgi:hypothetical protein